MQQGFRFSVVSKVSGNEKYQYLADNDISKSVQIRIFYLTGINGEAKVRVLDLLGREVCVLKNLENDQAMDLRRLGAGAYYLSIENSGYNGLCGLRFWNRGC